MRKALLRVLPGIELSAGAHTDSNSFLVKDSWASLGAQVSLNLAQLFTAPAAMAAAAADVALQRARREALAMAVLTQLHVALAGFGRRGRSMRRPAGSPRRRTISPRSCVPARGSG